MSDDLNELLETKPESNKPKTTKAPKPTVNPKPIITQDEHTTPAQHAPSLEDVEVTYSPSRVTNYKTLKALGTILKTFAYGSGIGGIISILMAISYAGNFSRYGGLDAEFYVFLIIGIMGIFTALPFAFLSESINVMLDIEANSRQAAKTLGRILKAQ